MEKRTAAPTAEAVLIQMVSDHCEATKKAASKINGIAMAAIRKTENDTERAFISQEWTLKLDGWTDNNYWRESAIIVPRPPLISVDSISYIDTDGNTQTLATTEYDVDTHSEPGRITRAHGVTWPDLRDVPNNVTIVLTAGYGTTDTAVPEDLRHAIKMLADHWYQNREAVIVGTVTKEIELGYRSLIAEYETGVPV